MATSDDVRRLALALPDAVELPHHGFPSFRVRGKIFATVRDDEHVHIMLTPEEIREAVAVEPGACEELWWGKSLSAVRVTLAGIEEDVLESLLRDAWGRRAGKRR